MNECLQLDFVTTKYHQLNTHTPTHIHTYLLRDISIYTGIYICACVGVCGYVHFTVINVIVNGS